MKKKKILVMLLSVILLLNILPADIFAENIELMFDKNIEAKGSTTEETSEGETEEGTTEETSEDETEEGTTEETSEGETEEGTTEETSEDETEEGTTEETSEDETEESITESTSEGEIVPAELISVAVVADVDAPIGTPRELWGNLSNMINFYGSNPYAGDKMDIPITQADLDRHTGRLSLHTFKNYGEDFKNEEYISNLALFRNVTEVGVGGGRWNVTTESLQWFMDTMALLPNLEVLELDHGVLQDYLEPGVPISISKMPKLKRLDLRYWSMVPLLNYPGGDGYVIPYTQHDGSSFNAENLPVIEDIWLDNVIFDDYTTFGELTTLKELDIILDRFSTENDIEWMSNLVNLEKLELITYGADLTPLNNLKNLKELDILSYSGKYFAKNQKENIYNDGSLYFENPLKLPNGDPITQFKNPSTGKLNYIEDKNIFKAENLEMADLIGVGGIINAVFNGTSLVHPSVEDTLGVGIKFDLDYPFETNNGSITANIKGSYSVNTEIVNEEGLFDVNFDSFGGTGTMPPQTTKPFDDVKLNKNTFVKNGYKFIGWTDNKGNDYEDEQIISRVTEDITLYAKWEVDDEGGVNPPITTYYDVVYTATTGGMISINANQKVAEGSDSEAVEAIADNGYEFVRWSDGKTNARRYETNVDENIYIQAIFEKQETETSTETTTNSGGITETTTNKETTEATTNTETRTEATTNKETTEATTNTETRTEATTNTETSKETTTNAESTTASAIPKPVTPVPTNPIEGNNVNSNVGINSDTVGNEFTSEESETTESVEATETIESEEQTSVKEENTQDISTNEEGKNVDKPWFGFGFDEDCIIYPTLTIIGTLLLTIMLIKRSGNNKQIKKLLNK